MGGVYDSSAEDSILILTGFLYCEYGSGKDSNHMVGF